MLKHVALIVLAAITATVLAGCGGGSGDVVAHVGTSAIARSALVRLMTSLAPEHLVPSSPQYTACMAHQQALALVAAPKVTLKEECEHQYRTLERQALDLLISSQWLIQEAAQRGLRVSEQEVPARLRTGQDALPAGADAAAAQLQARAELAALAIRLSLRASATTITQGRALDYYRTHPRRFERQELRYVDLAENFPTVVAATAVKRQVEAGSSLAKMSLHEVVERFNLTGREGENRAAEEAIFAASPHVLGGPILLNKTYSIFEVTRVIPPVRQPFGRVERSIQRQLAREQQRATLAAFIRSWRAKWVAVTDCARGYVIERCRQYSGATKPEDPLTFGQPGA